MALQHLRSGTANKRPIPTAMSDGQLAVSTNLASPGLFFKDSNGDLVKAGPVHVGTTAPNASPASTAATALVANTVYQILTTGTSDFTAVGAGSNAVGVVFTATGTTTGTGTVSGQQGVEKGEQWLDTTNSLYVMKVYDGTGWRVTDSISLANGTAAAPSLHFGSDTNTGLFRSAADSLAITTAGTKRVTVDSSGNLNFSQEASSNYPEQKLKWSNDSTTANGFYLSQDTNRNGRVWHEQGLGILFGTNNTERMQINSSGNIFFSSGNVGVTGKGGTDTAFYVLDTANSNAITVDIKANGSSTFASTVQVGGNPFPGTATGFAAYIDGSIALSSASATGTIFFGYTTGSSTQTTTIKGNGNATFAGIVDSAGLTPGYITATMPSGQNASSWGVFTGRSNTSTVTSQVLANGTASFAGTVSAQGSVLTSDQRFKENITDAKSQLADVTALGNKLRNWDWTADAPVADKDTRFLGLVAQEAETICPGIVTTIARTKNGAELTPEVVVPAVYKTKTVPAVLDKEGKVVEAETTEQVLVTAEQVTPATYEKLDDSYKGIKNDILIMKLLGAVAELSAEVAALKAG